jgi:hypothetical protein
VISAAVGAIAAAAAGLPPTSAGALIAYAAAVGVAIDFDHFPVARLTAGDWRALRFCLSNPSAVVLDQSRIFEEGEVSPHSRLLRHLLVGGVLVAALSFVDAFVAAVTAVVLYAHLVSDVAWDIRKRRRKPREEHRD